MRAGRRGGSSEADTAEQSLQEALLQYRQHAQKPFAVTRGAEHRLVYVNAPFLSLAQAEKTVLGMPIADLFPGEVGLELARILDRSFRDAVDVTDVRVSGFETSRANFLVCAWPVIGEGGNADAVGLELSESVAHDSPQEFQRQLAERMLLGALREHGLAESAEDARRRASFLAEAGRLLADSLDQVSTLLAISKLALPTVGDWCIVDVLNEAGTPCRLAIYHSDPEKERVARALVVTWAPGTDDAFGAPAVAREARATLSGSLADAPTAGAGSVQNMEKLRELGIGPMLTVPLVARNKLLGAITFVRASPEFIYEPEDILLADALAARGALALDNAQSYERALASQRSAETANRLKTAFLGAMSHELRTPLSAIGGYIDLLDMGLRGPVTEQQRNDLARVKKNQEHLALLVTEILDFARSGSGSATYAVQDVDCCATIGRAVDMIEPLFNAKDLTFEGVSGDPSLLARADPDRVTQILVNLLSNAIKFTPPGGRVSAGCEAQGSYATFTVNDTGIGISRDKADIIFEPFVQLKTGGVDSKSGVGLGLAISRDLARAMHGDLTVKSKPGEGAHFTLSLPRALELSET